MGVFAGFPPQTLVQILPQNRFRRSTNQHIAGSKSPKTYMADKGVISGGYSLRQGYLHFLRLRIGRKHADIACGGNERTL